MSNFICSECGMTNIDCGSAGYKTPKEIELEKENKKLKEQLGIATKALEKIEKIKVGKENNFSILIAQSYSREALKEMECVK